MVYREADRKAILTNDLPCIDATAAGRMREEILPRATNSTASAASGVRHLRASLGIGDPMFDGIENRIAQTRWHSAVKGVEFGMGCRAAARQRKQRSVSHRCRVGRDRG
ncbi:MAG: chorismate synthase [Collinsella sp.]